MKTEFVVKPIEFVDIPELDNLFSDKEYRLFKDICKTRDKENEILYSLVRSRMKIIYSFNDVSKLEEKGINYDFDYIIREIDRAAKKLKIQLLSEYINEHKSNVAFQYAVRRREDNKGGFYCPVLIFTSEIYYSDEWNRIQDWFNENHPEDMMLEILPCELSFADKLWPFTTIIVSAVGNKYEKVEG